MDEKEAVKGERQYEEQTRRGWKKRWLVLEGPTEQAAVADAERWLNENVGAGYWRWV